MGVNMKTEELERARKFIDLIPKLEEKIPGYKVSGFDPYFQLTQNKNKYGCSDMCTISYEMACAICGVDNA